MKQKGFGQSVIVALLSVFVLSACKVASDKPEDAPANAAFTYFLSQQYAINSPSVAKSLSSLQGRTVVGTKDSSFEAWADPALGCKYAGNDGIAFKIVRTLDVGDLTLTDASGVAEVLPKNEEFYYGYANILLTPGMAKLATAAKNPEFSTELDFRVPLPGSQISLKVESTSTTFNLPTPNVVDQNDPNFWAAIKRGSSHTLSYVAPEGTTYVKATFSDGFVGSDYKIVCYGVPEADIHIPAEAFNHFKVSNDGRLEVDFVSVTYEKDLGKIKEGIVVSYKRHIHGRQDIPVDDRLEPVYFGALQIQ